MRLVETSWRRCAACAALALVYVTALAAAPLDVQVKDVRTPASAVRTTIEIRDLVPERFKRMMDDGRILHLRVQAELWESRPIWDRLVYPAIVRVFRLGNSPSGREVAITDPDGASTTYRVVPSSIPVVVDLGDRNRLTSTEKYYVHVVATLGTLADREADEVGDESQRLPAERVRGNEESQARRGGNPAPALTAIYPARAARRRGRRPNTACWSGWRPADRPHAAWPRPGSRLPDSRQSGRLR